MIDRSLFGKLVRAVYTSERSRVVYGVLIDPEEIVLPKELPPHRTVWKNWHTDTDKYWARWADNPQEAIRLYESISQTSFDYANSVDDEFPERVKYYREGEVEVEVIEFLGSVKS
jgi:hypothetical protein